VVVTDSRVDDAYREALIEDPAAGLRIDTYWMLGHFALAHSRPSDVEALTYNGLAAKRLHPKTAVLAGGMMKRRWFRRVIRISLGFLAILIVPVAVLFILKPEVTIILIGVLIAPLIYNTHPPPIAEDQLVGASIWNLAETNRKLTASLQRKFPTRTSEDALKSTLLNQGFKPLPPPPGDCVPRGQLPPAGRVFTRCYDPSDILRYDWGNGICHNIITVHWTTNDRREITDLNASYIPACL
jgi:hypothetical protein